MHATVSEAALLSPTLTQSESVTVPRNDPALFSRVSRALIAAVLMNVASVQRNASAADPVDALAVQPAPVSRGSLLIAGGGNLPPEIRSLFVELAGGKSAKIVIVPTASADADVPEKRPSFIWGTLQQEVQSVDLFHTRDRAVADNDEETRVLDDATGLWFTGGDQKNLKHYSNTRAHRKICDILRRGGVVGGTSAGAAIMSGPMIEAGKTDPVITEGLNFLPGTVIDQHFLKRNRGDRLQKALKLHPTHIGVGIDEATALVVRNNIFRVVGHSTVSIATHRGEARVLKHDDQIDMRLLGVPGTVDSNTVKDEETVAMP